MNRRFGAGLGLVVLSAVAATEIGCVRRTMSVRSDPPGALVYMNGQEIGRTPLTRDFTWYGAYDVQLRKEGYETLSAKTPVTAPWWQWPPFDLFAELVPGATDRRELTYTLHPASTQPADATEIIARAESLQGQLESSPHTRQPTTKKAINDE
jgi:hypothetical protein